MRDSDITEKAKVKWFELILEPSDLLYFKQLKASQTQSWDTEQLNKSFTDTFIDEAEVSWVFKAVANFLANRLAISLSSDSPSISREWTGLFAVRICFISFQKSLYLLCVLAVTHFSLRIWSSLRLSLLTSYVIWYFS